MAVDDGDLPREFIEVDETGGGILRDDDKVLAEVKPETIADEAERRVETVQDGELVALREEMERVLGSE